MLLVGIIPEEEIRQAAEQVPDKVKGNAHYHALCADGINKKDIPIRGKAVAVEKQRDYKADESRNRACKPAYDPCVVLKAFAGEIHLIVVDPDVHILLGELQTRGKRVADAELKVIHTEAPTNTVSTTMNTAFCHFFIRTLLFPNPLEHSKQKYYNVLITFLSIR